MLGQEGTPLVRTSFHIAALLTVLALSSAQAEDRTRGRSEHREPRIQHEVTPLVDALRLVREGRQIFRYDTFGDEAFWGERLRLHEAVATLSPRAALAVGLKVDSRALPRSLRAKIERGEGLDDPATTLALLELDAVVGVRGVFDEKGALASFGTR